MDIPHPSVPLVIDVVSDVVCPWCYLGKHRLAEALTLVPDARATIRWHPFQLDPTIPQDGVDRDEYFERKFGRADAVEPAHRRLEQLGRQVGIDYHFDRIARTPNSLDAHRLTRWATEAGLGEAMVERLFRAYFAEGVFIGDRSELARLAGEIGLDAGDIAARLASDRDRADVEEEIEAAAGMGITGVPCFIVDGRYAVMGAQEPAALAEAIRRALGEKATASAG
jgi:predicted DsbA family dithiol-disulfide isomerase